MRVIVGNNLIMVAPWHKGLEKPLTLKRRIREPDGRFRERPEKLFALTEINGVQAGYAPAGLLGRVNDFLDRNNIDRTFVDNDPPLPVPDFSRIDRESLRAGQYEALQQVAESKFGIVAAATGYGKTHLIIQLALMYPELNIIITTARKAVVKTLYDRLISVPELSGQVGVISSGICTGPNFRVVVSTIRSLHKTNREKCDLLLADESHNFGAEAAAEEIARFPRARRFGFSASPKGRADNADLATEALFGPIIFDFSYQEAVDSGAVVPIEAHVYRVERGESQTYTDTIAVNRHGLWRNPWRNQLIADIARRHSDKQVLILCDTIDHVMNIKRQLPEAAVAYSNCSKKRYEEFYVARGYTDDPYLKPKDIACIQEGLESGEIRLCVSTMIFKEGVDFRNLGVLIRSDGTSGDIASTQLPGRLSRTCGGKDVGILVDFMDVFDRRLRARSLKRLSFYRSQKWEIKYDDKF